MGDIVKKCVKCNKKKNLDNFYSNNKWREELFRDRWCKVCYQKLVLGDKSLREYFDDNRRKYPDNYWGIMYEKSKKIVIDERPGLTGKDRDDAILKYTRNHCARMMNFRVYYKFIQTEVINENVETGDIRKDDRVRVYNAKWHGDYTDEDIKYLEEYYEGLDNDFKLSNHSYRDYAKKVCKASLAMDKAFSEYQNGVDGADKKYEKMKNIFDTLSQSSKFAEKSRSTNDVVGFGSLGELIASLEEDGFLNKPVKFPDDDIDLIVDDFRWIICAVGEKF